jgi:outer membrane protein OmpA-like peptidoglycan-associated protein
MAGHIQYAPVYYDLYKAFKCTPFMFSGIGFSYYMPVNNRGVEDLNLNIPFGLGVELSYNHEIALFWRGAFVVNYGDIMDRVDDGDNDHFTTNEIGVRYYFSPDRDYSIPFGDIIWKKHGDNYGDMALLDSDGDGVADKYDTCPDLKGPISNKGCPEISKETYDLFDRALRGVQFDFNKASLKPASNEILDEIAILLLQNQYLKLSINGHTDNVGTDKYNENLSKARAETVKMYLIEKGIHSDRLSTNGFGESVPVSSNFTEEGRALNRRVVFQVNY